MTLQRFIKLAIKNKNLRNNFLNDPVQTLKEHGVELEQKVFDKLEIPFFVDQATIQGGYRP